MADAPVVASSNAAAAASVGVSSGASITGPASKLVLVRLLFQSAMQHLALVAGMIHTSFHLPRPEGLLV